MSPNNTTSDVWESRVASGDWNQITEEINEYGGAMLPRLLTPEETVEIREMYSNDDAFRSTVNMGRHRFGEGEYRYFNTPYPEPIERLKQALYPRLLPIARDWYERLGRSAPWPETLDEWLDACHEAGQMKSTAILLKYGEKDWNALHRDLYGDLVFPMQVVINLNEAGQTKSTAILLKYGEKDWNALHRDLYGDLVFPMQVVINLNEPGVDHTGGEFLLLEQRPRAQSRGTATLLPHGHGYLFTTRDRPVESKRGWSAVPVRHGVSAIRSGERQTVALVFHDAG